MSFPQTLTLKAFAKINLSLDITGILQLQMHHKEFLFLVLYLLFVQMNKIPLIKLQIYFLNSAESVLLFPFILKNRFPVRQVWPEEARMQPLYCMD